MCGTDGEIIRKGAIRKQSGNYNSGADEITAERIEYLREDEELLQLIKVVKKEKRPINWRTMVLSIFKKDKQRVLQKLNNKSSRIKYKPQF